MSICPKCGDYYADDLLAFCPADGMPLASVAPHDEFWDAGLRAVAEKEKALRIRTRKLRWRRAWRVLTTTLVATMVVCVVTVNGLIYLTPEPEETSPAAAPETTPTQAPTPTTATTDSATPTPDGAVTTRTELSPTTDPTTATTPEVITTASVSEPRDDDTPTPTPTPTTEPTIRETATPTPPITPTPTPTPTPKPVVTTTPTTTRTPNPLIATVTPTERPPSECSAADRNREREIIIGAYSGAWRRRIEEDRRKIIAAHTTDGASGVEAGLGEIEYQSVFLEPCTTAFVTARYTWQVRSNVNGTVRVVPVTKSKRFGCVKLGGAWRCS